MNLEEILHRKFHREQLEQSGESQPLLPISCDDMSDSEKISFIQFLVTESHKKDQQNHFLQQTIDALGERLSTMQLTLDEIQRSQHATCGENLKLHAQLVIQGEHLKKLQTDSVSNAKVLAKFLRESAKYRALYEVLRDEKFVGTSQKNGKLRPEAGRDDGKGDWDGTDTTDVDSSISETGSAAVSEVVGDCPAQTSPDSAPIGSVAEPKKEERPYRQGLKYNTMKAEVTTLRLLWKVAKILRI